MPQDTWLPEQVAFVSAMGNARANAFWEARLPPDFRRPPENDMALLRAYITDKYVERRYAAQGYSEPPGIDNYATHPVRRRGMGMLVWACSMADAAARWGPAGLGWRGWNRAAMLPRLRWQCRLWSC